MFRNTSLFCQYFWIKSDANLEFGILCRNPTGKFSNYTTKKQYEPAEKDIENLDIEFTLSNFKILVEKSSHTLIDLIISDWWYFTSDQIKCHWY